MLPAQPPHSRRISAIWNDTDSTCVSLGQDVAREAIREHHDGVVGERAADQRAHREVGRWSHAEAGSDSARVSQSRRCAHVAACRQAGRPAAPVLRRIAGATRSSAAAPSRSRPISRTIELLPARHRQRFRDALQQHLPVRVAVVADAPLEAADEVARDEAVAVHAHEARAELLLELASAIPRAGTRAARVRIVMYLSSALR